jgi:hypothetical protein
MHASATTTDAFQPIRKATKYFTVEQFSNFNPAFTEASLRNLIFKATDRQSTKGLIAGNGLLEAGAIIRIGRKVLIHEERFFKWIESHTNLDRSV